jgi:hypothetical protein
VGWSSLKRETCSCVGLGVGLECEKNNGTEEEDWSRKGRKPETEKIGKDMSGANSQTVLLGGMPSSMAKHQAQEDVGMGKSATRHCNPNGRQAPLGGAPNNHRAPLNHSHR